jgi:hypothetical protein
MSWLRPPVCAGRAPTSAVATLDLGPWRPAPCHPRPGCAGEKADLIGLLVLFSRIECHSGRLRFDS